MFGQKALTIITHHNVIFVFGMKISRKYSFKEIHIIHLFLDFDLHADILQNSVREEQNFY